MALGWKLVMDTGDPHRQAAFWAEALGYELEDNSALIDQLLAAGAVARDQCLEFRGRLFFRDAAAIRHPDEPFDPVSGTGLGRRVLFNRVPEPKTVKNRVHIDVHTDGDREATVARLEQQGATALRHVREQGGEWTVMADPEGNEFCVQ